MSDVTKNDKKINHIKCEGWNPKMKLCERGYCSAKQKYQVYPSAYANAYASKVCQGKAPDANGVVQAETEYLEELTDRRTESPAPPANAAGPRARAR